MTKTFLVLYFLLYYGILFLFNSWWVFRKTGKNPYVLGHNEGAINFVESSIKYIGLATPAILMVYLISERAYSWLMPLDRLEGPNFAYAGIGVMSMGLLVCLMAQRSMRSSWRIGIGVCSEVNLIEEGMFRYSRNPFFLGTLLSYAGFFLVLPNAFSFAAGIAYYFLIQTQVRLEEESLAGSLGDAYLNYCGKVRRWV